MLVDKKQRKTDWRNDKINVKNKSFTPLFRSLVSNWCDRKKVEPR